MSDSRITEKRTLARDLFDIAVRAADPALALDKALEQTPLPSPASGGRLFLIAIGKAAPAMLGAAIKHAPDATTLCVTHHENAAKVEGVRILRAGHPVPDQAGLDAGREVMALLKTATEHDQVVALISGGGSALLPAPSGGITLKDKQTLNKLLLETGLDIVAMNLVRQQVSNLKGGGFLKLAAPARVTGYLLSDVIGNDLRAIASGPTVSPIGSAAEAVVSLKEAGVWEQVPSSIKAHLSSTAAPIDAPEARNILIGSNRHSLDAMAASGTAKIVTDNLVGDVGDAAEEVLKAAKLAKAGSTLLFGGETTVRLSGDGLGGRNQELALRVAMLAKDHGLEPGWVFLSGGTDGRDGPTEAAGGVVDAGTAARIAVAGGNAEALLANNDSNQALGLADDLLITEATGTNVADVQIFIP